MRNQYTCLEEPFFQMDSVWHCSFQHTYSSRKKLTVGKADSCRSPWTQECTVTGLGKSRKCADAVLSHSTTMTPTHWSSLKKWVWNTCKGSISMLNDDAYLMVLLHHCYYLFIYSFMVLIPRTLSQGNETTQNIAIRTPRDLLSLMTKGHC